jgi:hypothetical protein
VAWELPSSGCQGQSYLPKGTSLGPQSWPLENSTAGLQPKKGGGRRDQAQQIQPKASMGGAGTM